MAAQGSPAMAGPDFGSFSDDTDDLPRTLRREKEARAREARERAARERAAAPTLSTGIDDDYSRPQPQIYRTAETEPCIGNAPVAATVRAFDVPFARLVTFFLKAAIAAVPGVLLLGVILWFVGAGLEMAFPQLIKMKILIGFN
ncbi:FHA domain-containing protein [Hyphomicrobium denitrificans ATCC 51888]|uniref:FHA domain-containing protein n=1 Tax=Hyphomicrobium denitrificans (strain ATCC 51888 / DSM 1869 / NCIMB 11706 / TK 0415) TaxID=582899 RepID=D8JSM6_HYPDA|nr:hypothetical protein [Hyphomicrobium denitrificans]ADJ24320.1 FHA domain-containing protein [Hyphomicrobium denitrificans ATCC 51888]